MSDDDDDLDYPTATPPGQRDASGIAREGLDEVSGIVPRPIV